MKHLLLILLAGLFAAGCTATDASTSAPPQKCSKPDPNIDLSFFIEDTYHRNRTVHITHIELINERLELFLAAFNRTPPRTNETADSVVVFFAPTDPRAMVVLSKSRCIEQMGQFFTLQVIDWMRGVSSSKKEKLEKSKSI